MSSHPRVGVAAVIIDALGRLLVGKRLSSHGAGTWQLPGGHLEFKEDILACAERETEEETSLRVKATKIAHLTNSVFHKDDKHYITLFVHCEMEDPNAQPQVTEPDKCEAWYWKTWDEIKSIRGSSAPGDVLFLPLHHLLDQASGLKELKPESERGLGR